MGYGRSGSTFLDILLSNHPDVVSTGALINIFDWIRDGKVCACGFSIEECVFWSPIVQEITKKYQDLAILMEVQTSVEERKNFKKLLRGSLPRSLTSQYGKMVRVIFSMIADNNEKEYLLDSSKSARLVTGRAYALSKYASLNVKRLYLVRDGRAVIWSAMKRAGSPERSQSSRYFLRALSAMGGWVLTNLNCLYMLKYFEKGSVILVRYEDIVTDPPKELQRIGDFLELPTDLLFEKIHQNIPLSIGHNLGGNRLRFSGEITIQPDLSWKRKLPRFYKLLFWGCVWPLARRFGYSFVW